MYYNEGVQCWLGGENLTLDQAVDWCKTNLQDGSTITFELVK